MKKRNKFQAVKVDKYDIKFKSGLECFCYEALIQAGFNPLYEQQKFKIFDGFYNKFLKIYLPSKKSKNQKNTYLQVKSSKILDITYTPDFIIDLPEALIVIEVKGRANDRYPYIRKLFFKHIESYAEDNKRLIYFFEPHNQSHVADMITILLNECTNKPIIHEEI